MTRYAVIDFETSGLSPLQGDRALEIAAVIVENGEICESWQSLMNPGIAVPAFITGLTGITPAMVRGAPGPACVMAEVAEFVGDATLVAHNASFDKKFWEHELARIRITPENDFLCTLLISRRLYPWAPNHRLQTLADLHHLDVEGRYHRALADASMTARLFIQMKKDIAGLYQGGEKESGFLAKYQKTSRTQVKAMPETGRTRAWA
ncbi:MAG: 3'-5' exonuclease [bacterium]|nr:3'-5' exonuclease [bacterium]